MCSRRCAPVFDRRSNALLVGIFPASPRTAAASGNVTRCALSAIVVAVLQPLVNVLGRGGFFALLTVLSGGGGLVADWLVKKTREWSGEGRGLRRHAKQERSRGDCERKRET